MAELTTAIRAEHRSRAFAMMGESITYRRRNDSVNRGTGMVTASNTDSAIDEVLTSELTLREVGNSGGQYLVGDRVFRIKHADMPETPPKNTSEIIYGGATFKVVDHRRSSDTNVWDVIGRKP